MSTSTLPYVGAAVVKQLPQHPIAPLSAAEIREASRLLRATWPANINLQFKAVTLLEPEKAELLPYLTAERAGQTTTPIDRKAFVVYYIRGTDKLHEAVVSLSQARVESNVRLGPFIHGTADADEIIKVETAALESEAVKAELAKLSLPTGAVVVCDPWIYGSDGVNDGDFVDAKRMFQCFLYMRDPANSSELDSNHYALPLPVSPVVSAETLAVTRIDMLPTGSDNVVKAASPFTVPPPNEYIPEAQTLRTDLKPLNVIQPEGASFQVGSLGETGHTLEWQKWSMKIGFNYREGMVLYDVHYDGRPLFFRLSLSDMNIPYADPRHPYHKKAAFDLGDVGAGVMANNLKLGCDCLGSIHYLSGVVADHNGDPVAMDNAVCIHEQDNGIGWKHTNYRTGRAAITRNRELVIQSIITVANYEYIMAFIFNQAGEFMYEVRATGILSTQPIDEGVEVPWGTVVHPGVLASHHQHIFSLRVDPMIDGAINRLAYEEAFAMPRNEFNPHGVGYYTAETVVEKAGGLDLNADNNRIFKIQNAAVRNPVNGKPVAYKIMVPPFQKMLADKDSFHFKRAEFADHNIYVTSYKDDELYAGGKYTNQSRGGTGVRSFAARQDNVKDEDIVVWIQFGINHIPRIEDFPVMPAEIIKVALKPVNFFTKNPALDVPPSTQEVNKSVLALPTTAATSESACCQQSASSKL